MHTWVIIVRAFRGAKTFPGNRLIISESLVLMFGGGLSLIDQEYLIEQEAPSRENVSTDGIYLGFGITLNIGRTFDVLYQVAIFRLEAAVREACPWARQHRNPF